MAQGLLALAMTTARDYLSQADTPVYLFGSYATGKFTEDSDIDLAIFLDQEDIDNFHEDLRLMRLRRNVDLRIEPHSFARTDLIQPDPFIKEILLTGERVV